MNRRGFLQGILAAAAAPAIIKADALMRIRPPDEVIVPFANDRPLSAADFNQVQTIVTVDSYGPDETIDDIVRVTLRKYGGEMAENISRNNALMARLRNRQVIAGHMHYDAPFEVVQRYAGHPINLRSIG